jgi:hypothetical protein
MDMRLCRKCPPSALQSNLDLGLRRESFLKKREKKSKAPPDAMPTPPNAIDVGVGVDLGVFPGVDRGVGVGEVCVYSVWSAALDSISTSDAVFAVSVSVSVSVFASTAAFLLLLGDAGAEVVGEIGGVVGEVRVLFRLAQLSLAMKQSLKVGSLAV